MEVLLENPQSIPSVGTFSEDEREKMRMKNQAILALWLKMDDEERLLGPTTQCGGADTSEIFYPLVRTNSLVQEKKHRVIRLTDVIIFPKLGGQGGKRATITGTLEVHVNGFVYMASGFRKHFYFDDIKSCFFGLGGKGGTPLLHFHLHRPLKKWTEKPKDIEFHLVKCPRGQKMSDHDSNKIEKGKQNSSDDERLKKFVEEVHARWISLPTSPSLFDEIDKKYEGVIHWKGSTVSSDTAFALTSYDLIFLVGPLPEVSKPFTVFPLRDIEIVNLALLEPGKIDMTVIFRDFDEENVLEVKSIALESLADIKDRLNYGNMKYYVNTKQLDWKAKVKEIAALPEEFINMGGWDKFELEDRYTSSDYDYPLTMRKLVG
ncbi:FACT complex subunit SPT16-like [Papaver somniferum]|uniref:FACT complex subunit SPT16-like n=1 Tax=Papaver somniferum TaxID=3469 RepID=UPI000E70202A|nr:FACT complex subunit SPT16-like [Papaver somniferum]XP_026405159.1 FACT complex subunit SPT16-like [Papaver somniferum]